MIAGDAFRATRLVQRAVKKSIQIRDGIQLDVFRGFRARHRPLGRFRGRSILALHLLACDQHARKYASSRRAIKFGILSCPRR